MIFRVGGWINRILDRWLGIRISAGPSRRIVGIEDEAWDVIQIAERRSMGSAVQRYTMWQSVNFVLVNEIPGDIVEFGVWRGGMSMIAAEVVGRRQQQRGIYLFDTFEGMTAPSDHDFELYGGVSASALLSRVRNRPGKMSIWAHASLDDVRLGMSTTSISPQNVHYVVGDVFRTVPEQLPKLISVCRIDLDWYDSTLYALESAWPRISDGGVLIFDDYDHWAGAREAVDQFFSSIGRHVLLLRTEIGRVVIK